MVFQPVKESMQNDSTDVNYAMSVGKALNILAFKEHHLLIMTIPAVEGHQVEIIRLLRETTPIPIIVFTPKLNVHEKIALFHAGVNACLEQPVDISVCIAQAHSLIRLYANAKKADSQIHPLVFGTELIINPIYRHVIIDGEPLQLTRTEFDLLLYMAKHPNQIFSRQQLYQQVWQDDLGVNGENTVRAHIGNLYKKLAEVGKNYIQNSRGVGYKFVPPAGK